MNEVALVTGGAGGIGRAVIRRLNGGGVATASVDRTDSDDATFSVRADIAEADEIKAATAAVEARLGPVRHLVCAAGVVSDRLLVDLDPLEWARVVDASLTGTFLVFRAVLPSMIERRSGKVVALSSGYATKGCAGGAHYAAAKAGVEALVKSAALEVAGAGITVNAVAPGPVDTAMLHTAPDAATRMAAMASATPSGRIASAEDVAGAVLFLLGPDSDHITGQVVHVNGGLLMP